MGQRQTKVRLSSLQEGDVFYLNGEQGLKTAEDRLDIIDGQWMIGADLEVYVDNNLLFLRCQDRVG